MAQKKIGIVTDDKKLNKFKTLLKAEGFKRITVKGFSPGVSTIFIKTDEANVPKINAICQVVEAHFKQSN